MCILCKNKKTDLPIVNLEAIQQASVDRKGLSNIYNINNNISFIDEVFTSPSYIVSGATKPVSGITTTNCSGPFTGNTYSVSGCTFVYNLSEIDEIDLIFNITGNTQYTGYTGNFCYYTFDLGLFPSNRDYLIKGDSVFGDCFVYSAITGNTIYEVINKGEIPFKDAQYILKDYSIFTTKDLTQNLKINTFELATQSKQSVINDGWYFVTVTNPEKPSFFVDVTNDISNNAILTTEIPILQPGYTTVFKLPSIPLNNKFVVYVNGIQLTEGLDWNVLTNEVGMFELTSASLEPTKDVLMVTYIASVKNRQDIFNLKEQYLNVDAAVVSNITTGITSGVTALTVNYNNIKNRQEVLLTQSVLTNYSVIFVINGVRMAENVDYFISSTDKQKLIMSPSTVIKVDDAISIFYYIDGIGQFLNIGTFRTLTPSIQWYVPNSYRNYLSEDGVFLVQVTTPSDTNFLNPIQAKYVDFNRLQSEYVLTLDPLPTNLGKNFLIRVYFFKDYNILFNNVVTTRNVSDTASFNVNIDYAQNTY